MFGGFGRTWATILRRSDYKVSIESPDASGGCRRFSTRERRSRWTRRFSHAAAKTSRDLRTVEFEIPAGLSSGLW